jgi:hypothetical protein
MASFFSSTNLTDQAGVDSLIGIENYLQKCSTKQMETSYMAMPILASVIGNIHIDDKCTMHHLHTGMWHFQNLNQMKFRYQGFYSIEGRPHPPPSYNYSIRHGQMEQHGI